MPCYSPLQGHKSSDTTKTGKRKLTFGSGGFRDLPVTVACGQCIGCRLERSRQWAIRLMHEAQMHEAKCFITLTYRDDQLPRNGGLNKRHFQNFMKRLRKKYGAGIRYFHCGEYGETTFRPHYHACLFGLDFLSDRTPHSKNQQGDTLYTSETLNDLWGHGHSLIGNLTFETAAYTARYILKKVTGKKGLAHYERVDEETGEIVSIQSEYITMSLKPAIGSGWWDRFKTDVFPDDFVIMRGKKIPPPRYYYRKLAKEDERAAARIKFRRIRRASRNKADNTPERLAVKRQVKIAQIRSLKREL